MTPEPAIELRNVTKTFLLSHSGINSLKTMLTWWQKRKIEQLEVLKGINMHVMPGECVAVVGRNGAGKSTLLSLLARVYKPSSGEVFARGRLAPLLELGAGFHPDLSGVENIFFNGVILGLTRNEIQARVQKIIEFSELESQIDTPVRTYSSGMLARLGFSIAVHIDAEILLVDEVLAVGDQEFERKCYQKINELRSNGATILFVSHHLESIRKVADRCIWLKDGLIEASGPVETVLSLYTNGGMLMTDIP